MRTLYLFLLLCLLAPPVAAASFDPATVPAGVVRTHATTLPTVPSVLTTIPPAEAWLTIFTDPEGATAIIDSAKTVTTTNRVVLAPGTHMIVVIQSGYQDYATKVNLKGGTWTDLRVTLQPAPDAGKSRLQITGTPAAATTQPFLSRPPLSRLDIISDPPGARVLLNGSATFETTPVTLYPDPGAYTVTLILTNYEDNVTNVNLGAGQAVLIETEMHDTGPSSRLVIPSNVPAVEIRGLPPMGDSGGDYDDCMPGQQCLTVLEVREMYPQGCYSFANMICGKETLPNGTIHPMYCYIPPPGGAPAGIPQAPVAPEQGGVIESVLRFFGSLFGR